MAQNPHKLAQVWKGFQSLDHADEAFNIGGLEAPLGTPSDFAEMLVATHRVADRAAVMPALFTEFPPIAQADAGDGPGVGDGCRNVRVGLDLHLRQEGFNSWRKACGIASRLQRLDLYLAELHDARAILQRNRPAGKLAVLDIDHLGADAVGDVSNRHQSGAVGTPLVTPAYVDDGSGIPCGYCLRSCRESSGAVSMAPPPSICDGLDERIPGIGIEEYVDLGGHVVGQIK